MPEDMILKIDLKAAENKPNHVKSYVNFFFKNSSIVFSKLAPEDADSQTVNDSTVLLLHKII